MNYEHSKLNFFLNAQGDHIDSGYNGMLKCCQKFIIRYIGWVSIKLEGVVYTMDHEVVPRSYKIYDWLLNLSRDHFGLHQGNNCQSVHGVRGPPKTYLKAFIIH